MTAGSAPPSTTRAQSRSRLRSRALSRRRDRPPERPIVFVSHTAEEYGLTSSSYDWCYGAWYQIVAEHPEWSTDATFYLNIEGSGTPHPFTLDTPPELRRWIQRLCRRAARDGLLPHGFKLAAPTTWTEVWPFLAAGVPGINVSTFTAAFDRAEYHTQYDTSDRVDFDYLAGLAEVCARLLRDADAGAADELDFAARARDVSRSLDGTRHRALTPALAELERATGRARFTAIGRGLHGLDARESARYPHEQTAADVARLEEALEHLRAGKTGLAARSLARVGLNWLCADLGHEAFRIELARRGRDAPRATWAALGDPDVGPDLWDELASLRGEPRCASSRALARGRRCAAPGDTRGPSSNDASSAWPRPRPGGSSPCPRSSKGGSAFMSQATLFGRPLPAGGTIGVAAPASPYDARSEILRGVEWWEAQGYKVKLADGVFDRDDYVAGDPRRRAADLAALFADPEVDVVQCLQGGFGSAQAIPYLDFDVIRANPKPFVGYSDITALHIAIRQATGLATLYGYGLVGVGDKDGTAFSRDRLAQRADGRRHG